jgi:hypothetical protein
MCPIEKVEHTPQRSTSGKSIIDSGAGVKVHKETTTVTHPGTHNAAPRHDLTGTLSTRSRVTVQSSLYGVAGCRALGVVAALCLRQCVLVHGSLSFRTLISSPDPGNPQPLARGGWHRSVYACLSLKYKHTEVRVLLPLRNGEKQWVCQGGFHGLRE